MIGPIDYLRLARLIPCNHPQKYAHPYQVRPTVTPHADDGFESVSLRMTCTLCGKDNIKLKWLRFSDKLRQELETQE